MSLRNVLVCLSAGALAASLLAPCGVEAADAGRVAPLLLAQQDPDAQTDDGQGGGTDAAALLVRITRLEDRLRTLTGQVEQLQFQNRKLDEQLRKMQADVDFRFQDLQRAPANGARPAPAKRGDAAEPPTTGLAEAGTAPVVTAQAPAPAIAVPAPAIVADVARPAKRGDAFDPSTDPGAPGAPRPLGTTPPSRPLPPGGAVSGQAGAAPSVATPPHAPLDLTPNGLASTQRPPAPTPTTQEVAVTTDTGLRGGLPASGGGAATARGEFDGWVALYKGGQYDAAIDGLQNFVQKYPKDRLIPDATYFLGESYARQGRQREAAEQFLKLSTDYAKSGRAPDALLRLGVALNALGAKEQACATYQEVDRKYPTASSDVRASVERELKRARC